MEMYIVIGIGVVLAIVVIFIVRSYFSEDQKVVPIADIKEIQQITQRTAKQSVEEVAPAPELKPIVKPEPVAISNVTQHILKENLKSPFTAEIEKKIPEAKPVPIVKIDNQAEIDAFKETIAKLTKHNEELEEALAREVAGKKTDSIEEQKLLTEKSEKLQQVEASLDVLTQENLRLTKNVDNYKIQIEELRNQITTLSVPKEEKREDGSAKILEENNKAWEEKLKIAQNQVNTAYKEKEMITASLKEVEFQVKKLQERLFATTQDYDQKLSFSQRLCEELKSKIPTESHSKGEWSELEQKNAQLQIELKRLSDFNAFLVEKEKRLQYELTKAKAQTIGLEKICEDFKIQIEGLTRV